MARAMTLKALEEKEQKQKEELKALQAEIRKARRKEIARIKKEQKEKDIQEALTLIELSKEVTLTIRNENGERIPISFYDRLKQILEMKQIQEQRQTK